MAIANAKKHHKLSNAGKGRVKGVPNKMTTFLKEAALQAAVEIGSDGKGKDGMIGYLKTQAVLNPGPFMGLLAKIMPTQLASADGGQLIIKLVNFDDVEPEDLLRHAANQPTLIIDNDDI